MTVFAHLVQRRAPAEASDVSVTVRVFPAAPGMVRPGNAGDVLVRQAQLACVDEQNLVAPRASPRKEPETDGDSR